MRDYVYIWHDPLAHFVVASGVEFRDLALLFQQGGVILLKHQSEETAHDNHTGLQYVEGSAIQALLAEDIYSWGDFTWADFQGPSLPLMAPQDVAALLYFSHAGKPLTAVKVSGLNNRFLCRSHDDGWYLQIYYSSEPDLDAMFSQLNIQYGNDGLLDRMKAGDIAIWRSANKVEMEEKTFDIDRLLNRRLRDRP